MKVVHCLDPIYNSNSKVLILGSFPSIKSRELGFYYSHPQNKFWKILESVYEEKIEDSIEKRKEFVLKHNIALFDVIKTCDINLSSDSSIKNIITNDLSKILEEANIKAIFTTGRKAFNLYNKYILPKTNIAPIYLPSTSPANCSKNINEKLYTAYKDITKYT